MSATTGRAAEPNWDVLARLTCRAHFRAAAEHERERLAAGAVPCQCEVCEWVRGSGLPGADDDDEG